MNYNPLRRQDLMKVSLLGNKGYFNELVSMQWDRKVSWQLLGMCWLKLQTQF